MTKVFDVFRSELQTYADRGIFQNLSCNNIENKVSEFKFHWMTDKQFSLRLNVISTTRIEKYFTLCALSLRYG